MELKKYIFTALENYCLKMFSTSRHFLGFKKKLTIAHSKRPPIGSNKNVIFNLSAIQQTGFCHLQNKQHKVFFH